MDPILIWNEVALEANAVNHTNGQERGEGGPTRSSRALAIVHLAMYDAYVGIDTGSGLIPLLRTCSRAFLYLASVPLLKGGAFSVKRVLVAKSNALP